MPSVVATQHRWFLSEVAQLARDVATYSPQATDLVAANLHGGTMERSINPWHGGKRQGVNQWIDLDIF